MKDIFTHWGIILFGWAAVLYPLWVRMSYLQWGPDTLLPNLFPFFGLAAASLLWLHSLSVAFEPWLRQHINFDRFVSITASLILICIVLHPLLVLAIFQFNIFDLFAAYGVLYIELGVIGWLLLITYDITKPFRKNHAFFVRHWNKILIISNIGFLVTFFHALLLGSDLQAGPLRYIWIFYGITATLALFYTYAVKPFLSK